MKEEYIKQKVLTIDIDDLGKKITESTVQQLADVFSNDSILEFREASEVYNMGLLKKAVDVFELFYKSEGKKSLGECIEEKGVKDFQEVLNACSGQSLIRLLSECEDGYLEGILASDIKASAIENFGKDYEYIGLFQPSRENISDRGIIEEIRAGICHRRYIIGKDGIFVFNPAGKMHNKDFSASVKWELFRDIHTIKRFTRKFRWWEFEDGDVVSSDCDSDYLIYDERYALTPEELREIFPPMTEEEYDERVLKDSQEVEENRYSDSVVDYSGGFKENIGNIKIREYKKKKTEDDEYKLSDLQHGGIDLSSGNEIGGVSYNEYKLSEDQCELLETYYQKHNFDLSSFHLVFSHLENTRPHVLDHLFINGIINAIKDVEDLHNVFQIDSLDFSNENLPNFGKDQHIKPGTLISMSSIYYCYELIPTYLKMLYIINSYLNDTNVRMGLSKEERDETRNIRDAFAHGHYSLIPGAKRVLLYDPRSNYHGKFDINVLYEERMKYESERKENLINQQKIEEKYS